MPGSVGAGGACDLLIFRLGLKCQGKDRSLAALDSSYERNSAGINQAASTSQLSHW